MLEDSKVPPRSARDFNGMQEYCPKYHSVPKTVQLRFLAAGLGCSSASSLLEWERMQDITYTKGSSSPLPLSSIYTEIPRAWRSQAQHSCRSCLSYMESPGSSLRRIGTPYTFQLLCLLLHTQGQEQALKKPTGPSTA